MDLEKNKKESIWGGGNQPMKASYGKLMMWFFLITDALTFSAFLGAYGYHRFTHYTDWPIADEVFTHFPFIHGHYPLFYVALMTFILIMSSVTMVLAVHAGHHMNKKGVIIWMFLTIVGGVTFLGSQAWEWYHFIKGTDKGALLIPAVGTKEGQKRVAHYVGVDTHHSSDDTHHSSDDTHHSDLIEAKYLNGEAVPQKMLAKDENGEFIYAKQIFGAPLTGEHAFRYNEYGHTTFSNFFFFITGFHGFHVFTGVLINIIIFINVLRGVYHRRGHYEMVEKVGLYWHFVDLVWVFVFTFFYLV